jgi:RNA polymerase sigma-70 factor (ECF subfamily)
MILARSMSIPTGQRAVITASVTDAELAVRSREGDEEAFEILYRKYKKPLFNFIYRMVGDYDRSLDLYHDVFVRVITAKRYEPRARFSTWLYRIATNLCINELKKRRPFSLDEEFEKGVKFRATCGSPEEYTANGQLAEKIKRAVDGLTDIQRAVFTLRHYQGLSYEDIARVLKCPVGTVKSRLNSSIAALRRALNEEIKEVTRNDLCHY